MNNGFKKGHKFIPGGEKGWFKKGTSSWNKGKKFPRKNHFCIICKIKKIHPSTHSSYCKPCAVEIQRKWRENNREKSRQNAIEYYRKVKRIIFEHYGGTSPKCACCEEKHYEFLSLDHVKNDGASHRRKIGVGLYVYRWIIKMNFPKGFQILCFNCNCAKSYSGQCPHKKSILNK